MADASCLPSTCERGDIRLSADGILIYGPDSGARRSSEITVGSAMAMRLTPNGRRCGKIAATCIMGAGAGSSLQVALAILQSARERREITLAHQVAVRD